MTFRRCRRLALVACIAFGAALIGAGRAAGAEIRGLPLGIGPRPGGGGVSPDIPVTLSADRIVYDEKTGVAVAEGDVTLGLGNRTIRADRIRYDANSGEAEFAGNVHYELEGDEFSFDRIVLNLRTELGTLYNGRIRVRQNNFQIASKRFEKTGKQSFVLQHGEVTTCPCERQPDWKFGVGRSKVTLNGYAVARDVTFRIRDVPVLWFPWAAFPVKLTRQSGFLLPTFSHSSTRGYSIELPYYWAINRWSDATVTLNAMSRRGYRPEVEYRFVVNDASEGAVRATAYRDRVTGDTRYRFYGENRFRYADRFALNAGWDIPSDDQYYVDLVDEDILRTARHVASRGFGAWRGRSDSQALSVVWVDDLQGTSADDNTVQRLPEYTATFLPRSLGRSGLTAGGDLQATYFYRRAGDREVRGRGSANLSRPITLYPSVTLTPFLSVDLLGTTQASDWSSGAGNGGRVLPNGGATLETDFERDFAGTGNVRFVHVVSPVVGFRWVPGIDQHDIPITDMWSRVGRQRQLLFSIQQRLLRIDEHGPSDLAALEVSWALETEDRRPGESPYVDPLSPYVRVLRDQMDLAAGRVEDHSSRSSDIYARLSVTPASFWRLTGETLFDPRDSTVTFAAVGGEWKKSERSRVLLEYRTSRDLATDIHSIVNVRPFRFLGVETSTDYSIRNGELTDGSAALTLFPRSQCWNVGVRVNRRTRPDETSVRVTFELRGIGTIGM